MNSPQENHSDSGAEKHFTIKVIGLGEAGGNVLSYLAGLPSLEGMQLIGLDTDSRNLARFPQNLCLGQKLTRGMGTGGDPEVGRAAAMAQPGDLKALCAGAEIVFLIGGFGGGFATGAMSLVAEAAKETGALVLAIVTFPFEFEGVRRQRQAQQGFQQLKHAADAVICLPNQGLAQLFDQNCSIVEVFQQSNQLIAQNVLAIWRLATQPGLIKVDFAALCSVTRGRHTESSSATVEASGPDRSQELSNALFSHPFLRDEKLFKESEAVLVSFVAGSSLTMKEVTRVMERINAQSPNAHIIFGVALDEALGEKLSVTLIISRRNKVVDLTTDEERSRFPEAEEESSAPEEHRGSRFSPPAPALSDEKREKLFKQKGRSRQRKKIMMQQGQLPLEIISRGRFEKSEPTIHHGEDLDVPTYLRKNISLN